MKSQQNSRCDPESLRELTHLAKASPDSALAEAERLLERFPHDGILHFLRGSFLANAGHYAEALAAMSRAVSLRPDFHVARFQMGVLLLTMGDFSNAVATWKPLESLPAHDALRLFAAGLSHFGRDEFRMAVETLERGVEINRENQPLNVEISRFIAAAKLIMSGELRQEAIESEVDLLLRRHSAQPRKDPYIDG